MSQALAQKHSEKFGSLPMDAGLVVAGSLLMAVCAHVSIPLWFTPVPITLQTFGVAVLALSLGGWRSAAALSLYLIEGASGVPVFSPHGLGGIAQLVGPTGGYLMAYPLAALIGGMLAERSTPQSKLVRFTLAALSCDAIILFCGATWLLLTAHRPVATIFMLAVLPFLPGEILKSSAAVVVTLGKERLFRTS